LTKSILKNCTLTQNLNFLQLKPKLTLKYFFLVIKPYINSIKPPIKFNWVHKHLILDFFLKLNFSLSTGLFIYKIYCQILIFEFLSLLNQFLAIFRALWQPLLTVIIFWIFFNILFYFLEEKRWIWGITKKWIMTRFTIFLTV